MAVQTDVDRSVSRPSRWIDLALAGTFPWRERELSGVAWHGQETLGRREEPHCSVRLGSAGLTLLRHLRVLARRSRGSGYNRW